MMSSIAIAVFALATVAQAAYQCSNQATITVVESIPVQVDLGNIPNTTYDAWHYLVRKAKKTIDIAAFYVRLTDGSKYPPVAEGWRGKTFFQDIIDAVQRGVTVRLVQNMPNSDFPDTDSQLWAQSGVLVRSINWTALMPDHNGILHTKMMIIDANDVYLGSANMDWTSLTQVKELGAVVESCELLAKDTLKIMEMYWTGAAMTQLPPQWPTQYDTSYNRSNPADTTLNGEAVSIFLSASPNQFDTPFRAHDGDTIVGNIDNSTTSLCIEVMDYYPFSEFMNPNFYWPVIDDAIRRAAWRGVKVRLLFSIWEHTPTKATQYWESLDALDNVEVRAFVVPPLKGSPPIPFTRVNHAKMIVTDSLVYVGTSNLTPDYFISTGGLGWTIQADTLRQQVQDIFDRDWNSQYAVLCC